MSLIWNRQHTLCRAFYCNITISFNRYLPALLFLPSTTPFTWASARKLLVPFFTPLDGVIMIRTQDHPLRKRTLYQAIEGVKIVSHVVCWNVIFNLFGKQCPQIGLLLLKAVWYVSKLCVSLLELFENVSRFCSRRHQETAPADDILMHFEGTLRDTWIISPVPWALLA